MDSQDLCYKAFVKRLKALNNDPDFNRVIKGRSAAGMLKYLSLMDVLQGVQDPAVKSILKRLIVSSYPDGPGLADTLGLLPNKE